MYNQPRTPKSPLLVTGWSTRLLILAIIGILFLTLFPFQITLQARLPANRSPFLLGGWGKGASAFDAFLNVLLFIPFGFAITEKVRETGKSRSHALVEALILGALSSYGIEVLQLYIPGRDSGWEDVITNTSGSVAGFILFEVYGNAILRGLSIGESTLEGLVEWPRANVTIPLYFALWCALSIPLQMQTRLSNWNSDSLLMVGNDAPGQLSTAWKGELFRLQLWDRAIQSELARKLTTGKVADDIQTGLLADYDFSKRAQLADQKKFLPALSWTSPLSGHEDLPYVVLDGRSWLTSTASVTNLVDAFQKTNQFAIRLVCRPAEIRGSEGRIVGIWKRSGALELRIRQEDANLIFWFRNPLSVARSDLVWHIQNVFEMDRMRDILFSYDGSSASLYVDGKLATRTYRLSPGTALTRAFRSVRTDDLDGYNYIYYFLVFFTGGILLGISGRSIHGRNLIALSLLPFTCLPALLLELTLVSVSGRAVSLAYMLFSVLLALGGSLWINCDVRNRGLLRNLA